MGGIIALIIVVFLIFEALKCIRVVPQAQAYVLEFLGSYKATWGNGLHFKIPLVERVAKKVSLKEQIADFQPQPVITKDNVTVMIDAVAYYKIFSPQAYAYGVEDPLNALGTLAATNLRNIIGGMDLDETLTSRDKINGEMQVLLDKATDAWGIKVGRVELKNITPPNDIRESMEKQMKAERERRQTLLEAEAHKEAAVKRAQGDKEAMVLMAEAERDAAIAKATGEAESIRLVYEAQANGLKSLTEAPISENVMTLQKLDALKALGDGQATKLVVPTDLASSAGVLSYVGETLNITKDIKPAQPKPEPARKVDDCCDDSEKSKVTKELAHKKPTPNTQAVPKPQVAAPIPPQAKDLMGQAGTWQNK